MTTVSGLVEPHLGRARDFLPKPCDPCHLVQLVHDLLPIPAPNLILDPRRGQAQLHGIAYSVSPRRMDLLVTLAQYHPQPLTAAELVHRMAQERGVHTSETSVRTMVSLLRRQLASDPDQTSWMSNDGQGYYLTCASTLIE